MLRYKGYTLINVSGLALGLAACLLIFVWVNDELSYDKFHTNADRTYRALWKARFGDNEWNIPAVPVPLAPTLGREFPEVEHTTQFVGGGLTFKKADEYLREQKGAFVDSGFFQVFTVPFVQGNPQTALSKPNAVVLTTDMAQRYFGNQNPLGQTMTRNDGSMYEVTGIVQGFPAQSHIQFDFLTSLSSLSVVQERKDHWSSAAVLTYFTLKAGTDADALQKKLQAYVDKHVVDETYRQGENYTSFPFQRLTDIHLGPRLEMDVSKGGSMAQVRLFGVIACFILALACINFINLTTARSMTRAREVGVRKELGAGRFQLGRQFFAEAVLHVLAAVALAVGIAQLALPRFNALADKELALNVWESPFLMALIGGLVVGTTLLSGLVPAFVLSSFKPVKVIKGEIGVSGRRNWLRQGLVVLQFGISSALIVGTLVVNDQLHFMQDRELGFQADQVLVLRRATALRQNYNAFLEHLKTLPAVQAVGTAQSLPGDSFDSTVFLPEQPANYKESSLSYALVDPQVVDVLKMKIMEGRNFDPARISDSTACLINEAAAKRLGWDQAIGKQLTMGGWKPGQVIGVVQDFHFQSLHHEVEPLVLLLSPWQMGNIAVRLRPGNVHEQVAAIKNAWAKFAPQAPVDYTFLDADFQKLYLAEERTARVFSAFSVLALLIACLGLFGLASFTAAQRTKEIGVRRVLGASSAGIVALLSKDFLKLVLLAFALAAPVAWYYMNGWLQDFAYRTPIGWAVFATAGLIALGIAFLTISVQSVKAALENPVQSLRNE
mgnify:CR=1 FL=1